MSNSAGITDIPSQDMKLYMYNLAIYFLSLSLLGTCHDLCTFFDVI